MNAANAITKQLLAAIPATFPGARAWRQNVGAAYPVDGVKAMVRALLERRYDAAVEMSKRLRPVEFGLPGQPDIDGWVIINGLAVLTGIEVKTTDRQRPEQKRCQEVYVRSGAIYVLARSVEEGVEGVRREMGRLRG